MQKNNILLLSAFLGSALGCSPPDPEFTERIIDDQSLKNCWTKSTGDLNGDQRLDILLNGAWLENTGDITAWKPHVFTDTWTWKNAFVAHGDFNGDGRTDLVLSPSELAGTQYRISWFEAPADPTQKWQEHVVAPDIETVVHSVAAADLNRDGRTDLAYAEMTQGVDPDEVVVLFNQGKNEWTPKVISRGGSHSVRIVDVDGDGDLDIFGANWNGNAVKVWFNEPVR